MLIAWDKVIPILIGSGISIVTTVGMFLFAQSVDKVKKTADRKRMEALEAYVGLIKLTKTLNLIENLARHIDEQIEDARENQQDMSEPASFIKPIIGASFQIEDLTAQETSFLSRGDGEFLAQIWEIQQRARNSDALVKEYSKFRLEYDAFIETRADGIRDSEGTVIRVILEGNDAKLAHLKLGRLNQIIVPLVSALDEDRKIGAQVIERYIKYAREKFGTDFPVAKFEMRKPK